jgi:hypothetical protein
MKARPQPQREPRSLQLFLRIKHPSLDPREITRVLAIEPTQTIIAGTSVSSGGVRRLHSESYWIAELPAASLHETVEKYGSGAMDLPRLDLKNNELLALGDVSECDIRILLPLKASGIEAHQTFLQQVNREGGSVTLLVNRGDEGAPFVIKQALAKLAQLGIELEVD